MRGQGTGDHVDAFERLAIRRELPAEVIGAYDLRGAAPQTYLPRNSARRRGMVTGDHDNTDARSGTMSDGLRHPLARRVFAGEQPREDEPSIRLLLINPGTGL